LESISRILRSARKKLIVYEIMGLALGCGM
jgi:hypothetical protein